MKHLLFTFAVYLQLFSFSAWANDPFAPIGDKAEEATNSLMDIAIPIFILVFVGLIICRALNIIGNRLLAIATISLAGIALAPTFVEWMLNGI